MLRILALLLALSAGPAQAAVSDTACFSNQTTAITTSECKEVL